MNDTTFLIAIMVAALLTFGVAMEIVVGWLR